MFKKMKENKKKGFTLVELIVVLVILAILAALLIPALTGYIDKAKNKSVVAETRQAVMAAQTLVDEAYGKKDVGGTITIGTDVTTGQIEDLAELTAGSVTNVTLDTDNAKANEKIKIKTLTYTKGNKICTYQPAETGNSDGDYNVTNK